MSICLLYDLARKTAEVLYVLVLNNYQCILNFVSEIKCEYPLNLSISIRGGKEIK